MKIWHDDIRRPPDSTWRWARTNAEAINLVIEAEVAWDLVTHLSLDHDLGLHQIDPAMYDKPWELQGLSDETGQDLCRWLAEQDDPPLRHDCEIIIHSWNPPGAEAMRVILAEGGLRAYLEPFQAPR